VIYLSCLLCLRRQRSDGGEQPPVGCATNRGESESFDFSVTSSLWFDTCDDTEFVTLGGLVVGPKPFGTKGL